MDKSLGHFVIFGYFWKFFMLCKISNFYKISENSENCINWFGSCWKLSHSRVLCISICAQNFKRIRLPCKLTRHLSKNHKMFQTLVHHCIWWNFRIDIFRRNSSGFAQPYGYNSVINFVTTQINLWKQNEIQTYDSTPKRNVNNASKWSENVEYRIHKSESIVYYAES